MSAKSWLIFFMVASMWGTGFMWNEFALRELRPMSILLLRMGIGVGILGTIVIVVRPPWPTRISEWLALAAMGIGNLGLPHFLIVWGQQHVDSAVAAVLVGSTPLFTVLLAHLLLRDDRLTGFRLAGAAMGFGGIVVLLSRDLTAMNGSTLGQLSQLAAAASFGASSVLARRFLSGVSAHVQAFVAVGVAELALAASALVIGQPVAWPALPMTWIAILALGLFVNGVSLTMFYHLLTTIGPSRTQMVSYAFPLVAVVLGVVVLREPISLQLIAGGGLILAAVALFNRRSPA